MEEKKIMQRAEEIDPKLLKNRSQELEKLSSILSPKDSVEYIVSCNTEIELEGGKMSVTWTFQVYWYT